MIKSILSIWNNTFPHNFYFYHLVQREGRRDDASSFFLHLVVPCISTLNISPGNASPKLGEPGSRGQFVPPPKAGRDATFACRYSFYKQMNESTAYLIENCRRGKQSAQLALYTKYAQRLYLACLRITGNRMEAEEAMQDAFLKVFSHLAQYRNDQNFEAWIHRIAVRTAIDHVRRQTQVWEEFSPNHHATEPAEEDDPQEDAVQYAVAQIKAAAEKLPAGYRLVLTLYLFEGYDTEEIASILNIQPSGVRTQYLRAKRKLLEIIKAN